MGFFKFLIAEAFVMAVRFVVNFNTSQLMWAIKSIVGY